MVPAENKPKCVSWGILPVLVKNESCELLLTPLLFSLWGEELYSSLTRPPSSSALRSGLTASTMGPQQSSPHGSLSCLSPRPADWLTGAIYDCIRLHKRATHNVPATKEAQSSILHVDHFPFNLFCLAEASRLIKDQSLQIQSLKVGAFNEDLKKDTLFASTRRSFGCAGWEIHSLRC